MKNRYNKSIDKYYANKEIFDKLPQSVGEYAKLEKVYFSILKSYCKYWLKINYKSTIKFLLGLTDMNWDRLHENDEQKKVSAKDKLDSFGYEFHYVCDRFSYTRMLRLHWKWLVFSDKFFKELEINKGLDMWNENYLSYSDWIYK